MAGVKYNNHSVGAGVQQALEYAEVPDIPFDYSSKGEAARTKTGEGRVSEEVVNPQCVSGEYHVI